MLEVKDKDKDKDYLQYLKTDHLPDIWCPGCGNGLIVRGLIGAIAELGLDKDEVAVIGGIGCSSRGVLYLDFNTMYTTHGRAVAFATGLKMARPEMTTILLMGDGDSVAIGGNHFIHAARRNIDLTAIIFNNGIYGMTGGQMSPTTGIEMRSMTSPYGDIERPTDIVQLAIGAGATYVARTTTYDFQEMQRYIKHAIAHEGFSVVDVLTQCPTYYGRLNQISDPYEMVHRLKEITIPLEEARKLSPEKLKDKLITGEFVDKQEKEFTEAYRELCARAQGKPAANARRVAHTMRYRPRIGGREE